MKDLYKVKIEKQVIKTVSDLNVSDLFMVASDTLESIYMVVDAKQIDVNLQITGIGARLCLQDSMIPVVSLATGKVLIMELSKPIIEYKILSKMVVGKK